MLMPVRQWIDAFNAAQTPLPETVFTDDVTITDQFSPYVWSGKAAAHAWSEALNSGLHSARITHEHVDTTDPRAFMINRAGDRASFVLPATLTYQEDGKPGVDAALWLFVVVKGSDGWKIAADTWTRTDYGTSASISAGSSRGLKSACAIAVGTTAVRMTTVTSAVYCAWVM
jgi:ketosteroid isomerase-like protein